MEKGVDTLLGQLKDCFNLSEVDMKTYSPLTLAYIGDGIYELIIRTVIVGRGNCPPNKLHKKVIQLVKASAQAELMERLLPLLTEEEEKIYRRGRNAKSYTIAKNASMQDYRKATGLEALMGYLYLNENTDRVIELIRAGLPEDME